MICIICRASATVVGVTSTVFEKTEMRLNIGSIPALVCPECGEAYVEESVALELLQAADAVFKTGIQDVTIDYNDPIWHSYVQYTH